MRRPLVPAAITALVVLGVLRAASTPPWPDDWDGIGFVEAVTRFDLDHFVPHPPGYPVYVALLRLAAVVLRSPILAANAVAVVSGVGAVVLLALAAARTLGAARAAWIAAFVAFTPLVWRASTAVGSEAPALVFACAALFGATRSPRASAWWVGTSIGLGLGVRLSWAPLYLLLFALVPRGRRLWAAAIAVGATLAWAVPFAAIVGPLHLVALAHAHATGHFETWGGTVLSEPGAMRVVWLARDLFVDGLGADRDSLGIALGVVGVALSALGLRAWRAAGYPRARLLLLIVPYLVWVAFGQNLHQQPRHVLPLVLVLAAGLAVASTASVRARDVGTVFLALLAARTATDAYARRTTAPPGEQIVELARSFESKVVVYGGPSARFFELAPDTSGFIVGSFGDVRLAVSRLSPLPAHVLVTSELPKLSTSSSSLVLVKTLCRPERLDRRAPCIDVFDWQAPFLKR